jgi:hypothetical protein
MDEDIFINCVQCRTRISVTGHPNNPTLRVEGNSFEVVVRLTPETAQSLAELLVSQRPRRQFEADVGSPVGMDVLDSRARP